MEIAIVGYHNGRPVALPIPFPTPHISNGEVRPLNISQDGHTEQSMCIFSEYSGNIYEVGRKIKDAIYGAVYAGARVITSEGEVCRRGDLVAIKRISRRRIFELRSRTQEDPMKEIAAMQYIGCHPNVMNQIECIMDADNFYSIMPFVRGGELYDFVENNGRLEETQARLIFGHILNGLAHLQSVGVCHRDMSMENILITEDGDGIIIDLGMCLRLALESDTGRCYLTPPRGPCGKKNYMAPCIVANEHPFDGFAVDMWAAGVILFMMLTGVPPVDIASPLDPRFRVIRSGQLAQMLLQWGIILSPSAVNLLHCMLKENPADRLSIAQIMSHPWMAEE